MTTIAIIAGGNSSEAEISIKSAVMVQQSLDSNVFTSYIVAITGKNWQAHFNNNKYDIDKNDFSFIANNTKIIFNAALIMIHGTPGENGLLQSYFELIDIPYTTCGVLSSALTFNKYATKIYLRQFGVKSATEVLVRKSDNWNANEIIAKTGLPCFVKPNEAGSSFGVTKVKEASQLSAAIEKALTESNEVLIEEFIEGAEITCGVLKTKNFEKVFPIAEIVPHNEFFDVNAKYNGQSEEIIPARISEQLTTECQQLSSKIYDWVNCKGIVRIDYIIKNNQLYMLEINTVPGMSPASIIPQMLNKVGITVTEMYKMILGL